MLNLVFPIQGAASFSEVYFEDGTDNIVLPADIDTAYTIGVLTPELFESGDLILACSKDGKTATLALAVVINGTQYTAEDFNNMSMKDFFQVIREADK